MIQLIKATKSDWSFILELRNGFYENFYKQTKPIELDEHTNYLESQLTNPKFHHWIIEYDDKKINSVNSSLIKINGITAFKISKTRVL